LVLEMLILVHYMEFTLLVWVVLIIWEILKSEEKNQDMVPIFESLFLNLKFKGYDSLVARGLVKETKNQLRCRNYLVIYC
jgi:hypothetical protein